MSNRNHTPKRAAKQALTDHMELAEQALPPKLKEIKNHQLSWWFDGEPLKAVLKDSATFGMGLWDH